VCIPTTKKQAAAKTPVTESDAGHRQFCPQENSISIAVALAEVLIRQRMGK
jgi:hypothetical protein